jgi:hypothetical protein
MLSDTRTSLARQQLSDGGITVARSPASKEGHSVENDGKIILHVENNGSEKVSVTIKTAYVRAGLKLSDRVIEVQAGSDAFVGPFPVDIYNQDDGRVHIDYSQTEGVEVSILKFA